MQAPYHYSYVPGRPTAACPIHIFHQNVQKAQAQRLNMRRGLFLLVAVVELDAFVPHGAGDVHGKVHQ
jgi:hypothetical protein